MIIIIIIIIIEMVNYLTHDKHSVTMTSSMLFFY